MVDPLPADRLADFLARGQRAQHAAKRAARAGVTYRRASAEMNATEKRYAERLEILRAAGEVSWYRFQPFSLRLAPRTHYRPDFAVQAGTGRLEVHEVKGHWEDDARAKIKVAAETFPCFVFRAFSRARGGGWNEERWS